MPEGIPVLSPRRKDRQSLFREDAVSPQSLVRHALNLSLEERARLAGQLLASLEPETDGDTAVDEAWLAVARMRREELRSGAVAGIPAEEVLQRALVRLR